MTTPSHSPVRHTLRKVATTAIGSTLAVSSLMGIGITPASAAQSDITNQSSMESKITVRASLQGAVNHYRKNNNLPLVTYSSQIATVAQERSDRAVTTENLTAGHYYADDRLGGGNTGAEAFIVSEKAYGDMDTMTRDQQMRLGEELGLQLLADPATRALLDNTEIRHIGVGLTEVDGSLSQTGKKATLVGVVEGVTSFNTEDPGDDDALMGGTPYYSSSSAAGKDVPTNHPYMMDIVKVREAKILNGWSDGTFKPESSIERGASAAVAYRMAGSPAYTAPAVSPFKDVTQTTPFYKEITWVKSKGYLNGYADGTFRPGAPMERFATAAMLYRMAGSPAYTAPATSQFRDISATTPFYKEIHWMKSQGISNGWNDGTFRFGDGVKRGVMSAYINRYMN